MSTKMYIGAIPIPYYHPREGGEPANQLDGNVKLDCRVESNNSPRGDGRGCGFLHPHPFFILQGWTRSKMVDLYHLLLAKYQFLILAIGIFLV